MEEIQLINKITVKKVIGNVKVHIPEKGSKDLMLIYGNATGYNIKETDYGPSFRVTGMFEAENIETGQRFRSGVMYLPPVASDLIVGELDNSQNVGVQFGFKISIAPSNVPIGYEYVAKPVVKSDENDFLALMRSSINGQKALPPKKEEPKKK